MAEEAKVQRATAKRLLTMTSKQMKKGISNCLPKEAVQSRFQAVYKCWMDVMEKHATYLALKYPDDTEPSSADEEWLQPIESEYDNAESECENYLKSSVDDKCQSTDMAIEAKKALRACKYEESNLVAIIGNLRIVTDDEDAATQTIKDAQNDIKLQLDRYRNAQRDYVMLISDDAAVEAETKSMKGIQALCAEVNLEAGKVIQSRTIKHETKRTTSSGVELKLERMKMPAFNGKIREYPSFKTDFERQVMPSIKSSEAAAYVLKSCLSCEPLEIVTNVDDDIKQMWSRLDERYGRSSKITDAIMYDIKHLKTVPDGDGRRFAEFVNTVERSYRDLSRISMESEISNSTIVSLIEEKLPNSVKSLWCLEVSDKDSKVDDRNKFPFLLEFLLKHKRATEYGSNDLRSTKHNIGMEKVNHITQNAKEKKEIQGAPDERKQSSGNDDQISPCWIHPNSQHDIQNCRLFTEKNPVERMELANEYKACWCCLRIGHRKTHCYRLCECSKEGCKRTHHQLLHDDNRDQDSSIKQNHIQNCSITTEEVQLSESDDEDQYQTSNFKQGHLTDSDNANEKKLCLLQLMTLKAGSKIIGHINVMWDS